MEQFLSVPQVAKRFEVTNQTVRNWIASGRLSAVQATPQGRHRIPAIALEAFEREARLAPTRRRDAGVRHDESGRVPQRTTDTELARVVSAVVAALLPDAVILFGSRARGDFRPDSDFDLAIVAPDGVERRRMAMTAYEAIARVEGRTIGVDVVVLTPRIIAAERDVAGSIVRAVMREGVPVFGSAAFT